MYIVLYNMYVYSIVQYAQHVQNTHVIDMYIFIYLFINPQCACARVTVLGLSVCVCVFPILAPHAIRRTNSSISDFSAIRA